MKCCWERYCKTINTRNSEIRKDCSIRIINVLPNVDAQPGVALPISFRKRIKNNERDRNAGHENGKDQDAHGRCVDHDRNGA